MTTEEKAKAYDEALERARRIKNGEDDWRYSDLIEIGPALTEIFPELRESEDEITRKRLINLIRELASATVPIMTGGYFIDGQDKRYIAYLEKQKYDRMKPIYDARESFESALEKAWNDYHNGYENVDKLEDDYVECAHAKGFREGYLFGIEKQKDAFENGRQLGIMQEQARQELGWPDEKKKEHQNNSDAPEKALGRDLISPKDKDKNLDEIAQDYVDGVKEYNPEPTWDLMQTAVCYGYHYREQKEPHYRETVAEGIIRKEEQKSVKDKIIEDTISYLNGGMCFYNSVEELKYRSNLAYRLKSLRPSWRPSEEQMDAIDRCVDYLEESDNEDAEIMESLQEQLHKLM